MFKLIECDHRYKFILLRCLECNDGNAFDNDNFEVLQKDKVVIKKGVNIICPKCGASQPMNERLLTLESPTSLPVQPKCRGTKKSQPPFWMTRPITTQELMSAIDFNE